MSLLKTLKSSKGKEVLGIIAFAGAILLIISLFSYYPKDPTWFFNSKNPSMEARNAVGAFGAFLSRILYQTIGVSAWLIPVILIVLGWRILFGKTWEYPITRTVGFGVMIISISAFLHILLGSVTILGSLIESGGIFGKYISGVLIENLNIPGALIVLITCILMSAVITTKFSFRKVFLLLKEYTVSGFKKFKVWFFHRKEKKRKEKSRKTAIKKHAQKAIEERKRKEKTEKEKKEEEQEEEKEKQPHFDFGSSERDKSFNTPPLALLNSEEASHSVDEKVLMKKAEKLTEKFKEFNISGEVKQIHPGPIVTTYEFKPDAGIKYSRIKNMSDDLCLALKADSIRIDRISGKSTIGIEVPNEEGETIFLKQMLGSEEFKKSQSKLTLPLGVRIHGQIHTADLSQMPHLLIAGATGSGKSVAINAMTVSMLYKSTPEEVKFIMVDPKRLELGLYKDIPHLMTPVITEPKKAANVLKWLTKEMQERYALLASFNVRNIKQFNHSVRTDREKIKKKLESMDEKKSEEEINPLPYIVVVIDELADLMIASSKKVEDSIARLAQMARAVGIHLIIATQRPSVDVITGIIKANFPARISFQVSSKTDSRTILDANGAETLLGDGDMLFLPPGSSKLIRLHGPLVTEPEITRIVDFLKRQGEPDYNEKILEESESEDPATAVENMEDDLNEDAVQHVIKIGKGSISALQRRFSIGYNRAARLVDMMEADDIVGPSRGSKPRKVLVSEESLVENEEGD